MKTPVKVTIVTIAVAIVIALVVLIVSIVNRSDDPAPAASGSPGAGPALVEDNSHVLDDAGEGAVTLVEFIDFECEACGAFYPIVEDLREQYDGELTYVIRYFPLPGHANSTNAAMAVEAAAQQDRLEDMYSLLFETQTVWAESGQSQPEVFRAYAEELGLDMAAYDASIADPMTLARVQFDLNAGRELGVSSTPTFYLNGEQLNLTAWDDLENAVAAAVEANQ